MNLKVLVVEPFQLVRRGITSILSSDSAISICGEAENVREALEIVEKEHPDICIMNNRIHQQSGLDVIQKLMKTGTTCKFVYLTSVMTPSELDQSLNIGVQGVILKDSHPEELLFAVHTVHRGKKYYDFELLQPRLQDAQPDNEHQLTSKEHEVLQCLSEGLSNKEIANRLYITEYTVKKHVSQVLAKLNLSDRTKAALYFHSNKLGALA
ncbi:response regulator transcription factor [Paenibacillus sp. PL2-23]|uniref:response regulator transcription factor n=1 Tax=Paenibacillus sp. PL2-23 TaxID=2100729 RepID=UPI0030F9EE0A